MRWNQMKRNEITLTNRIDSTMATGMEQIQLAARFAMDVINLIDAKTASVCHSMQKTDFPFTLTPWRVTLRNWIPLSNTSVEIVASIYAETEIKWRFDGRFIEIGSLEKKKKRKKKRG